MTSTWPKALLEIKGRNLEKETWPKWECHNPCDFTAAQWAPIWEGIDNHTNSNRRPTLWPDPIICPVRGSYTIHPQPEKYTPYPSSHSWPTYIRFRVSWGTKYALDLDKFAVDISPIWLIYNVKLSTVWTMGAIFIRLTFAVNIVDSKVIWLQQPELKNQELEVPGVVENAEEVVALEAIWEVDAVEFLVSFLRIDLRSLKENVGDESSTTAVAVWGRQWYCWPLKNVLPWFLFLFHMVLHSEMTWPWHL